MDGRTTRRAVAFVVSLVTCLLAIASPAFAVGTKVWVRRYDGPGHSFDVGAAIATSPDSSRVFVTGYSDSTATDYDYETIAYSASSGSRVWAKRFDGARSLDDYATSIAVSPDGRKVFVSGYTNGGSRTGYDYATVAYSASTGASLWSRLYDGPASLDDFAVAVAVSSDSSKVFVTGYGGGAGGNDYATIEYAASNGATLWTQRYDGPTSLDDYATAIGVSPDGTSVFVSGYSLGQASTGNDFATIAYSSSGALLWTKRYNGPASQDDIAEALAVSPDGSSVLITGYSWQGTSASNDYATVAYSASRGKRVWVRRYNGPASGYDLATSVGVSPDSSTVFVTGYSLGAGNRNYDYATLAYAASTGSRRWVTRFNGHASSFDLAFSLGVSPDSSKVFVTGYSYGPLYPDYETIAYAPSSGTTLWAKRYNGPAHLADEASSLAVSPDSSKVFVTGYSDGRTKYDYATVAYAA
jgi:hypothetical protein